MRWPDFFIAGAPKSGTTSLYHRLRASPDVFMPKLKEPRFFLESIDRSTFFLPCVVEEKEYLKLFAEGRDARAIGEATPTYMMDPAAAAGIASRCPSAKLIFVLRDPIERAHSAFHFHETRHATGTSFSAAITRSRRATEISDLRVSYLLEPGFYARHLREYDRYFEPDQILVQIFEEVVDNERGALEEACAFLGVTPPDLEQLSHAKRNVALEPRGRTAARVLRSGLLRRAARALLPRMVAKRIAERALMRPFEKQPMGDDCRQELAELYRSDAEALEVRLGRTLPWFNRQPAGCEVAC